MAVKIWQNKVWNESFASGEQRPKISLLVSVYNNIEYFRLVFASIEAQTLDFFEVVLCDDGTSEIGQKQFQEIAQRSAVPIQHLWHEDIGVRKVIILNFGVIHARADYLAVIDGDCVLHPEFLREHFEHKFPRCVLAGRRLDLTRQVTSLLTEEKIKKGFLQKNVWWIILVIVWMKDNNGIKGIYVKLPWLRKLLNRKSREIVGCNFSLYRQDLIDLNGYDNRYVESLGTGEDSDIDFRLRKNGVRILPFCHAAVQYHLYHKTRPKSDAHERLFESIRLRGQIKTEFGISQLKG